jgi:hypothetical protein
MFRFPSKSGGVAIVPGARGRWRSAKWGRHRKIFAQAARRALLPDYAIAKLRCDSARTMRDVHDSEMPPHDRVEKVATELHRRRQCAGAAIVP